VNSLQSEQVSAWKYIAVASLSVCMAVGLVGMSLRRDESVELYAKRPLTPEEKKFVSHATSTPDKDLHRAPKLTSTMGEHDMDSFYDSLTKSTVVKDKKIAAKIKNLHKKASTLSAMHDINHFFDTLAQKKAQESKKNLEKENGKGKQALQEVNSYFDSLDAQEKAQNEKDILNLGTGASVAEVCAEPNIDSAFHRPPKKHNPTVCHSAPQPQSRLLSRSPSRSRRPSGASPRSRPATPPPPRAPPRAPPPRRPPNPPQQPR
jgi:hypothetical protein